MFARFRKPAEPEERITLEQKKCDEPSKLIIRNNSRIHVLKELIDKFGCKACSGRYITVESTVGEITEWCSSNGFFAKKSDLGGTVVLDVMRDKELKYR